MEKAPCVPEMNDSDFCTSILGGMITKTLYNESCSLKNKTLKKLCCNWFREGRLLPTGKVGRAGRGPPGLLQILTTPPCAADLSSNWGQGLLPHLLDLLFILHLMSSNTDYQRCCYISYIKICIIQEYIRKQIQKMSKKNRLEVFFNILYSKYICQNSISSEKEKNS